MRQQYSGYTGIHQADASQKVLKGGRETIACSCGGSEIRDIDVAVQLGAGHPMGPLHLSVYIGLDTCLYIVQGWVEKYLEEPAFVIHKCLEAKVAAGDLGREKTGAIPSC